jgi:hypothetical protein
MSNLTANTNYRNMTDGGKFQSATIDTLNSDNVQQNVGWGGLKVCDYVGYSPTGWGVDSSIVSGSVDTAVLQTLPNLTAGASDLVLPTGSIVQAVQMTNNGVTVVSANVTYSLYASAGGGTYLTGVTPATLNNYGAVNQIFGVAAGVTQTTVGATVVVGSATTAVTTQSRSAGALKVYVRALVPA